VDPVALLPVFWSEFPVCFEVDVTAIPNAREIDMTLNAWLTG